MSLKDKLKRAWFQGADRPSEEGTVTSNNPETLGYPNEVGYPKPPMATTAPGGEDTRPWEQKWFEEAARRTKEVMGPKGTEFKLKQEMQRIPMDEMIANAKLSASFTRTSKPQTSYWTVKATDKKSGKSKEILKATLEQLWGDTLDEENANMSATKEYGEEIIARIRKQGFARVAYLMTGAKLVKKAQEAVAPVAAPAPVAPEAPVSMPEEAIDVDIVPAVEEAAGEDAARAEGADGEIEAKISEVEMAETKLMELLPETAAEAGRELQAVEEELQAASSEQKEIAARLKDKTISASAKVAIMKIAQESFDAVVDDVLPGADTVLQSTDELLQKADEAIAKVDTVVEEAEGGAPEVEGVAEVEVAPEGAEEVEDVAIEASAKKELTTAEIKNYLDKRAEGRAEEQKYNVVPAGAPTDGRAEIDAAHPQGGTDIGDMTVGLPMTNKGDRFETQNEQQDHNLQVADKTPTGELNNTIAVAKAEGEVKTAKAEGTVKTAAVDEATKKYYADFYKQIGQPGVEFAKALTSDYEKKVSAAVEETEGRVKRAFELTEEAYNKGMCEPTNAGKMTLFDKISKFDDNAFLAFKEAVEAVSTKKVFAAETTPVVKTASKLPNIGQKDVAVSESSVQDANDFSHLSDIGWN